MDAWIYRLPHRRPRSQALPRPHGWVSGYCYPRGRRGKAQVRSRFNLLIWCRVTTGNSPLSSPGWPTTRADPCAARPVPCGGWSLWESGDFIQEGCHSFCFLFVTRDQSAHLTLMILMLMPAAGAAATWSGGSRSASATSPQAGTCVWMRRRACWWSTQRGPTPNSLLFASAPQRSKKTVLGCPVVTVCLSSLTVDICFPHPSFSPFDYTEQEKVDVAQKRDVEGMGFPEIKYGESMCFVQHVSTGLWLTYAALDAKAARLGMMKRKVLSLHSLKMKTVFMKQQYMAEKWRKYGL